MDVSAVSGLDGAPGGLDKELFGARLVTSDREAISAGAMGASQGAQKTYDLGRIMLTAAMQGKGVIADLNV